MRVLTLVMAMMLSLPALAAELESELADVQQRWAHIQYELPESERAKAFENLVSDAGDFVERYPGRAEPLIWQGIVLSTYAGAKGGLGALGLVKDARHSLEAALDIDPNYFFGDFLLEQGESSRARVYLNNALKASPRAGRQTADTGRREEIRNRLGKI